MKILFLHGWTSTPGGLKPTYRKDHVEGRGLVPGDAGKLSTHPHLNNK